MGVQADPTLTQDKAMTYLWDSGYDFRDGKLINPVGFVEMVRKNCQNPRDVSIAKEEDHISDDSGGFNLAVNVSSDNGNDITDETTQSENTQAAALPAITSNQTERIAFKDDGYKYCTIASTSEFITEGFRLKELSAAVDTESIYIKVRYVSPMDTDILLYLSGDAPGLLERYGNGTKKGDNVIIIRFAKKEFKEFTGSVCIGVGDENSIVLDKAFAGQPGGN